MAPKKIKTMNEISSLNNSVKINIYFKITECNFISESQIAYIWLCSQCSVEEIGKTLSKRIGMRSVCLNNNIAWIIYNLFWYLNTKKI